MSHRRPTSPRHLVLEGVLRNALRLAADSIEPGADGLERIRAKISARQQAQLPRWRTLGPIVVLWSLLQRLEPAVIWVRYAAGVVADRFRPESERPGRMGWFGWLRPAAAVATGVFVVAAASWAIAALPQVIAPAKNSSQIGPGGGGGGGRDAASSKTGNSASQRAVNHSPTRLPSPTRSCTTTPASPSPSPSHSPSTSPSASPTTTSTSGSPSSSPTPSTTSTSTSASPSPSAAPTAGSQAATHAAAASGPGAAVVRPAAARSSSPQPRCAS